MKLAQAPISSQVPLVLTYENDTTLKFTFLQITHIFIFKEHFSNILIPVTFLAQGG